MPAPTSDLPYDPEARRDTPLALKLKALIRERGPISTADYMRACLSDNEHGYYRTRSAIGRAGDFVTAPEISQAFGELIGLWCAVVWQQMGSPAQLNLVELGPGRGTMMRDALRAARVVPGFLDAVSLVLIDVASLEGIAHSFAPLVAPGRLTIGRRVRDIPGDRPMILVGNEFLDTCPVQQYVRLGQQIAVRSVGLDPNHRLEFAASTPCDETEARQQLADNPHLRDGDSYEAQDLSVLHMLRMFRTAPWAGLFIDYGHFDPARGRATVVVADTLQAVRNHRHEHPLTSPGEADLTCQVDFNDVKFWLEQELGEDVPPVTVDGPVTQAEFLGRLGIMERASRLMAANPAKATAIEMGVARLMAVPGMGNRFKAIGVRSAALPPLPGF